MTGIPTAVGAAVSGPGAALRIAKVAVPIILALVAFFWLRGVLNERADLRKWRDNIVAVTAAEMPANRRDKVNADTAGDDIRWLGREYRTHSAALAVQSAKLVTAKGQAQAAQNEAVEARKQAKERNKGRDATRNAILAPGRSTGLTEAEWGKL